jgi:hypothetical protein
MYRDGDSQPHEDREAVAVFDSKEMAELWKTTQSQELSMYYEHWFEMCEVPLNPTKEGAKLLDLLSMGGE